MRNNQRPAVGEQSKVNQIPVPHYPLQEGDTWDPKILFYYIFSKSMETMPHEKSSQKFQNNWERICLEN